MKIIGFTLFVSLLIFGCSSQQSEKNIYALIVSKDNEIVEETYFNGKTEIELMNVQSITKSVISLLVGAAIDKGYIANEDVQVSKFFTEKSDLFTEEKSKITIKHLLNHTSGLQWSGFNEHNDFLQSQDPVNYVLSKEIEANPGDQYNYNSGGTHLLSVILTKATGNTTLEFANEVLINPLQFQSVSWAKLNDGIYDGAGFGLAMHPKDLIKIGDLLLDNGAFNGTQVISQEWIKKSNDDTVKKETDWGIRGSKHGYGWYSAEFSNNEILYSMGYGGQFIFFMPFKKLVIVAVHNSDTPNGIKQQVDFISETLPELINKYGS